MKEEDNDFENWQPGFLVFGCTMSLGFGFIFLLLWASFFFAKVGYILFDSSLGIWGTLVLTYFFLIVPVLSWRYLIFTPKNEREAQFFVLAYLLVFLVKCNGSSSKIDIKVIADSFRRFRLTEGEKHFIVGAFEKASKDPRSVDKFMTYAFDCDFDKKTWENLYDILWSTVYAAGTITLAEKNFLETIARKLHDYLPTTCFEDYYRRYATKQKQRTSRPTSSIAHAYFLLQIPESATNNEVRNAYRARVKQLHPDLLRAQGLPDSLRGRANELMLQVNAAWELIKKSRGIK